jgi:phage FluMu protein Com
LLGFFEGGAIHADAPKPKPVKIDIPATKPQPAPEKPKQPIKSLKDIGSALAPSAPVVAIGFMYVKCPVCGEIKGFNAKQEMSNFHCNACNSDTELTNLVDLYSRCECGRTWHYVTNMTEEMFDIPCLDCGNPVPVGFNAKSGAYETIRQNTRR